MALKKLPTGLESFAEIRRSDYYYVDKTALIKYVIADGGKVTLFTRPRRFGKSLNMDMLKNFFEIGADPALFRELEISKDKEFCAQYFGRYPVISISLKHVDGLTFSEAFGFFCSVIADEAKRFSFLKDSDRLDSSDQEVYREILSLAGPVDSSNDNTRRILANSLYNLSQLLSRHFGTRTVILIDEYDVPLDKAHVHGYYDQMISLLCSMLGSALKTNSSLAFAVLCGCLRISWESIFTGLNNMKVNTITAQGASEYFGFTDGEVSEMLAYYGLADRKDEVREWYDGYRFGDTEIYCPWNVVNYAQDICSGEKKLAGNYWANSSSNDLVREFISAAGQRTSGQLEQLMNGGELTKQINENLTYRDLDGSVENLWSVLYMTGYLTGYVSSQGEYILRIPNREVQQIFEKDITRWFGARIQRDTVSGQKFYLAALKGDPEHMEAVLTGLLFDSISIRDTYSRKGLRENFYHGFVLGLLSSFPDIRSNAEGGDGYPDIMILDRKGRRAAILELQYASSDAPDTMEKACAQALTQIEEKKYAQPLTRSGLFDTKLKYGISFHKKISCVRMPAPSLLAKYS